MDQMPERRLLRRDPRGLAAEGFPDASDVRDLAGAELGRILARRVESGLLGFAHEDFTEIGIRLPGDGPAGEIP